MIRIEAADIWESDFCEFTATCKNCEGTEIVILAEGAEDFGEVGPISLICKNCGARDYGD